MRRNAVSVHAGDNLLDIVGTGGDNAGTFNISTLTAFIVAAGGIKVAKHGNRAATGKCGSADVLEVLGVNIGLDAEKVAECINRIGIGFMFAPYFHPAMKYAAPTRREIGIRTVFNILGPLTNPAAATSYLLGVADSLQLEKLACVLKGLGCRHSMVVYGEDGLDEITVCAKTHICQIKDNAITTHSITPEQCGLSRAEKDSLKGGDSAENARIFLDVLSGEKGPRRDAVLMNAAAAFIIADRVPCFTEGVTLAAIMIDSGKAVDKLNEVKSLSRSFS
jgi:anthranilate phosphoribosyltransferase